MTQAYNLSQLANKVNTSGQVDVSTGSTGTLPVANGGTGQTTYTDGQLLIGNTTGNTLTKATITAGTGISITNGAGSITIASSSGQLQYSLYTSGTSTWTCPTGVTKVRVICIGGGGGGGRYGSGNAQNGGDAGYAGIAIGIYTVTPTTGYTVTVGSGGAGNNGGSGSSGGTSSFGAFCSATGSAGGQDGEAGGASGANGVGSSGVFANSTVLYGSSDFIGRSTRSRAASATAPITWTAAGGYRPGASGDGATTTNNAAGGIGGVVYIEYVG